MAEVIVDTCVWIDLSKGALDAEAIYNVAGSQLGALLTNSQRMAAPRTEADNGPRLRTHCGRHADGCTCSMSALRKPECLAMDFTVLAVSGICALGI